MRYSRLFIPTLKEAPSDAEAVSHKLMVRGGFVRQLAAGLYIYLPLGQRVMDKINTIIREEMNAIGAQEVTMPVLHPAEIWQQTGRWETIGDEMFRLKDRGGRDMCLGMTHEEIMTWLAAHDLRSYRDLPQMWYQLQTKLRDEARPKSGVLRTREFVMKDSYSFDRDDEGLDRSYQLHLEAYKIIYARCGLNFHLVQSDTGMMGGSMAHEFMAPSPAGEDVVALCGSCGYAANVELALSVPKAPAVPDWTYEEVATPEKRTIDEVTRFLKLTPDLFIKSIVVMSEAGPVLALVRGDQTLHEKKLARFIGPHRPAQKDEVKSSLGVPVGFIGPMGHKVRMIADVSLKEGLYVAGANKEGYHVKGVRPGEHFKPEYADIHMAEAGDACAECGKPLRTERVIEIGNIFKLGTKYSVALKATFLDEDGSEKPIIMGSYGIGPARVAAAAIEQGHDENGMIWPAAIAPFQVLVIPVNVKDAASMDRAEEIYAALEEKGFEVLLDDRDERAGVKFKDADLIGIPWRVVIGEKGLKEGVVELKERRTGSVEKVPVAEAVDRVVRKLVIEA
ncbi:MAG: proline--tRNA ligase [Nitrospirae bacterium GWC2_57_13]|jgi:prolyl-tRNA synthetase|nr:MAG: proline--tRNA ligase [Nitrospirae bacterium GWC2_57_13]OGW45590.1 MAG: proline--tRNA ligase [Nitrospirae bacterium GWD2_57_8]HAS53239.1 proline--tRNA ligase [Nitrospiraceae bacterium]